MSQSTEVQIKVHPRHAADMLEIRKALCVHLSCTDPDLPNFVVRKKSIDARGKSPVVILRILLNPAESIVNSIQYSKVQSDRTGYIVGAGPAGYFAALKLISLGVKPVIFERGKDAQVRRRDLRGLQQFGIVNSNSNYCYGEGGAGTYSDGKLYTRSNKRGNVKGVLQTLVDHGAPIDIMIDAHPHIGSNKLPTVVSNIRKTILDCGGEIHFDSKVTDLHIVDKKIKGVVINDEKEVSLDNLILATGHSARDIYTLLESKDIRMDLKPFAIGVRIEHSQELIDDIQYGKNKRGDYLPAAPYRLACQIGEKGVYSFCMCPGGLIVPTATDVGEIVVNGMSLSKRDSPYANAGTVVEITPEDIGSNKAMDGIDYQRKVEQKIFDYGDGTQKAPAQRLVDFVEGKMSQSLNQSSYIPGIYAANMYDLLPSIVSNSLRQAIKVFGKKMNGYYTNEAQIIGLESRTSSPIRIPRDKETYMHEDCFGLFPCGEGAGYAGGIVSAAIDGENVALKVVESFKEG